MPPTEEEIVRRREAIRHALAGAGLAVAAPVIEAAARITQVDDYVYPDRTVARHGVLFHVKAPKQHLPELVHDWRYVNNYNKVYLAGMTAKHLATLGEFHAARQWFSWAHDSAHSRGQDEWIRAHEACLPAIAGSPEKVPKNPVGRGAADYARAQATLGNPRNAYAALDRAFHHTAFAREPYTAFTFPEFQWHAAASRVHTLLGNVASAMDHANEALAGFPLNDATSRSLVALDIADCQGMRGRRDDAREHLNEIISSLPRGWRSELVWTRATEVSAKV